MLYMNPSSLSVALFILNNQELSILHMVDIKAVHQISPPLCLAARLRLHCLAPGRW